MNRLAVFIVLSSFFSSFLNATTYFNNAYFVLKDGEVIKVPSIFFVQKDTILVWLVNYNKEKEINLNDIHRIQKIEDKNEAIVYMKKDEIYRIKFSFNMILKGNENPFYRNTQNANNISYDKISEIVFQ